MQIPDSTYDGAHTKVSVFNNTYNYINNLVAYMIDDYRTIFEDEGEGAEVMHVAERSAGGQQRHIFFKSTTKELLFGIFHDGQGKSYLHL